MLYSFPAVGYAPIHNSSLDKCFGTYLMIAVHQCHFILVLSLASVNCCLTNLVNHDTRYAIACDLRSHSAIERVRR